MSWFSKLLPSKIRTTSSKKKEIPEGLWSKCPACVGFLFRSELERNLEVWTEMSKTKKLIFPKDIFVYTSDEVNQWKNIKNSFIGIISVKIP